MGDEGREREEVDNEEGVGEDRRRGKRVQKRERENRDGFEGC